MPAEVGTGFNAVGEISDPPPLNFLQIQDRRRKRKAITPNVAEHQIRAFPSNATYRSDISARTVQHDIDASFGKTS